VFRIAYPFDPDELEVQHPPFVMDLIAMKRQDQKEAIFQSDKRSQSMKNLEARKAALARVMARTDDIIYPKTPTFIPESDPDTLLETVEQAYLSEKIGELLEAARKQRKVGKRELARALQTSHGRISALEKAENLELKSIAAVAAQLGFDVQVSLIPKDGGMSLNTLLQTMK
jgi:hypothetical protein